MDALSPAGRGSPVSGNGLESETKRRKVRKGTRSCWQCKRRKIRCSFVTPLDSICIGCRKRGTTCVSQQYPLEMAATPSSTGDGGWQIGDRIVRVEALIDQLAKQVGNGGNPSTAAASSSGPSEAGGPNMESVDRAGWARVLTSCEPSRVSQLVS